LQRRCRKITVPTLVGCCQKWSELLTLEPGYPELMGQDRWIIAAAVGLGALIVVLVAVALFAFGG
jgi:hypothetical protein